MSGIASFCFVLFLRFYLFMSDTERETGRDTGRGRTRLHAGRAMQDSIPALQDPGPKADAKPLFPIPSGIPDGIL